MKVWEDTFQVFRRDGEQATLMASEMSLNDAALFMKAWLLENYMDQETSIEVRRQPVEEARE